MDSEEAQVKPAEGSSEEVVGSETGSDPVVDNSHEQATETSVEAGTVPMDALADPPSDSKVSKKLQTLGNRY